MARPIVVLAAVALARLLAGGAAEASEAGLSGAEGHPRPRFPLALHLPITGDRALDAAARRAVEDWNAVAAEVLGVDAFRLVDEAADAAVLLAFDARPDAGLMGAARVRADARGVIEPPVELVVFAPRAWGQTRREVLFYQVVAHELGHALGLGHVSDPRSVMCCAAAGLDLGDPAVRQAYVEARRRPDLRTVRDQLAAHYRRFWESSR